MNCRKGYGSLRAVLTFNKMIYDYTEAYTRQDCYIVGGDFANFFMSIDKQLLWEFLEHIIMDEYEGNDKAAHSSHLGQIPLLRRGFLQMCPPA